MEPFELPDDVQQIIRAFSRPLTRPDWRSLHRDIYFYEELVTTYHRKKYRKLCRNSFCQNLYKNSKNNL